MKTIYKYKLKQGEDTQVQMPLGARILTAQALGVHVWIWAIVDTDTTEKELRRFCILKTGQDITLNVDQLKHIESVQFDEGALVLHVFEYPQH